MKKVAIVSCYFQKNYGSALQALATQELLNKNDIDNITIRYDGLEKNIKKQKYKFYFQNFNSEIFFGKIGYVKMRLMKKNPFSKLGKQFKIRDKKIKSFQKKFHLSKNFSNFDELSDFVKDFSCVIVGSDQLWLPSNLIADYYTLNWVPKNVKKISYATSFGISKLPEEYKKMTKDFIEKFNHVSVREQSGKKIIEELTSKDVQVICDPTLVFNSKEWDQILELDNKERLYKEKYIFCYFLGNNDEQRKIVKEISQKTGYKIVGLLHLNVYVKSDNKFADYSPYDIDSADFVNLIKHAEYVFTDSFHATVFSIIYHKSFLTFKRFKDNYSLQTNSRMDSLFEYLEIQERLMKDVNKSLDIYDKSIDYKKIDKKINNWSEANKDFIINAIND